MNSFSSSLRSGLPAVGLGLMSVFGVVAAGTVFAPTAIAQAPKQVKSSPEFAKPMGEAQALMQAGKFADALVKVDAAAPFAKAPQEKLGVEQFRTAIYANMKNNAGLVKSLEAQLALGVDAATAKRHKATIAGTYAVMGQEAKAESLTKAFVIEYGGSSDQYAYLSSSALKVKNYQEAVSFGQKAIDQSRSEGKKPSEKLYNIIMKAHFDNKNMDGYYAALERVAGEYPKELYWRALVERATKEPKYNRTQTQLDVFRALVAAKVDLKQEEQLAMGEQALSRGLPAEAEKIFAPLIKSGAIGGASDKNAERNKRLYAQAQAGAKSDAAGDLAQSEKEAATAPTGMMFVDTGEGYMTTGDTAKAIDLITKGLAKGGMDEGQVALAKLRLGIAQFKAGKKDDARKTWAEVKGDNGAAVLAKNWIAISKL
ncbi:MAG: hypothetical protein KGS00_00745 [Alphaproteobacteria bacterium]|nr:hypothetical protein [Alphaproteobacteria bacterium]